MKHLLILACMLTHLSSSILLCTEIIKKPEPASQEKKYKRPPLIPLETLFDNPDKKLAPSLSPDGQQIAYLAPIDGIMNIWVRSLDGTTNKAVTHDTHRGINGFSWTFDSKALLYAQDTNGNENWRLYMLDLTNNEITCLTPFDGVQARIIEYNKFHPHTMLIGLNNRVQEVHDIYRLDLISKEMTLLHENPGTILAWIFNDDLALRAYLKTTPDSGHELMLFNPTNQQWFNAGYWDYEEQTPTIFGLTKDEQALYLLDSRNNDTKQFVTLSCIDGSTKIVASNPTYDLNDGIFFDQETYEPLAASFTSDRRQRIFFNAEFAAELEQLQKAHEGEFGISSRNLNDTLWIILYTSATGPTSYWLYNRTTKTSTFLFYHQEDLLNYKLAPMESISFTSRDGLPIHGYLTRPIHKNGPVPLILFVHGGPWVRDTWGFNPQVQFFANRGYAVLQINYRGSTGYGKAFVNAANKEWGNKMHYDLVDAVQWAVDNAIADPKKVAIFGGSYGGYAALVGATFTPDLFCCAVDIVGPSNLITLLDSMPAYWKPHLNLMYKRIGNRITEEEFLKSRSPLFFVDAIKIPILVAQGAQDPRVKQAEAEQIVAAMRAKNIPHQYLLFPDEGHGFVKPSNQIIFMNAVEAFLKQHLG